MTTFETIKNTIQEHKTEIQEKYYVERIGVFGSYVHGEQKPESDIDILVEFNKSIGFFHFLHFEEYLEELLGNRIDLVTKAALKPKIGQVILEEVQYI